MVLPDRQMDSRSPNKGMYRTGTCAVFKVHGMEMPITIKEPLETCISYKLPEILKEFHAETGNPGEQFSGAMAYRGNLLMLSAICISRYW